jgi:hypothetical protein
MRCATGVGFDTLPLLAEKREQMFYPRRGVAALRAKRRLDSEAHSQGYAGRLTSPEATYRSTSHARNRFRH